MSSSSDYSEKHEKALHAVDAKDVDVLRVGWESVVGHDPLFDAQEGLHPFLFDVWVFGFEFVGEATATKSVW